MPNKYRSYLPTGNYDMVICTLIHQGPDMVNYMVKNISRYIRGKFLFIIHYNSEELVDEEGLPEWCWIVRDPIVTKHTNISLTLGLNRCIKFALQNIKFVNCMLISSGCVFIKEYLCPSERKICGICHHYAYPEQRDTQLHMYPVPTIALGNIEGYFKNVLVTPNRRAPWDWKDMVNNGWIYPEFDKHTEMHELFRKRNIKYVKGSQFPGLVFPYEVARAVNEDLEVIHTDEQIAKYNYSLDEIIFSSYSYDYSIRKGIVNDYTTVAIDWDNFYNVTQFQEVYKVQRDNKHAYAVSKVPYDMNHPMRVFLMNI